MSLLSVFATATLIVATIVLSVLGHVSPLVAVAVYLVGSVVVGRGYVRYRWGRA